MQHFNYSNEVNAVLQNEVIQQYLLNKSSEGIIICSKDSGNVLFASQTAKKWIANEEGSKMLKNIGTFIEADEWEKIIQEERIYLDLNDMKIEVESKAVSDKVLIFLRDKTKITNIESELNNLKNLNGYLQNVYENYSDDTLCITDEKGMVEFCGEACERHCGMTAQEIIGKNIYDLEKQKYFYPSATVKTLKTKKTEVVIQDTKIGTTLITIGIPIFQNEKLEKVISISRNFAKEIEIGTLLIQTKYDIEKDNNSETEYEKIVTCSKKMYSIISLLKMVASTKATILLTGNTGTGKGVLAEYIHAKSERADKPFVQVNCGAIAENIMESELYGYEGGAFTGANREGKKGLFEIANGGTIFLDEIAEMSVNQQVKLLHVLQERSIRRVGGSDEIKLDVRIIVATNKNLEERIKEGAFREDLYYRLNVVAMHVPDLKERKEDIPLLINHFLNKHNREYNQHKEISKRAVEKMSNYAWPGNVRELENMIEMLALTINDNIIDIEHLPPKVLNNFCSSEDNVLIKELKPLKEILQEAEIQAIKKALDETGSPKNAGEKLGIDRSTVTRKINMYGINNKED